MQALRPSHPQTRRRSRKMAARYCAPNIGPMCAILNVPRSRCELATAAGPTGRPSRALDVSNIVTLGPNETEEEGGGARPGGRVCVLGEGGTRNSRATLCRRPRVRAARRKPRTAGEGQRMRKLRQNLRPAALNAPGSLEGCRARAGSGPRGPCGPLAARPSVGQRCVPKKGRCIIQQSVRPNPMRGV